jgi:hypothetical protein
VTSAGPRGSALPGNSPSLLATPSLAPQNKVASSGRGILAMDESNATCGKRLESIGLTNTEDSRRAYRELLVTTPGLGQYISGAIMFEETLFQSVSALAGGLGGLRSVGPAAADPRATEG